MRVHIDLKGYEAHSGFDALGRPLTGGTARHQAVGTAKEMAHMRNVMYQNKYVHLYRLEKRKVRNGKPTHWKIFIYSVPREVAGLIRFEQGLHSFKTSRR